MDNPDTQQETIGHEQVRQAMSVLKTVLEIDQDTNDTEVYAQIDGRYPGLAHTIDDYKHLPLLLGEVSNILAYARGCIASEFGRLGQEIPPLDEQTGQAFENVYKLLSTKRYEDIWPEGATFNSVYDNLLKEAFRLRGGDTDKLPRYALLRIEYYLLQYLENSYAIGVMDVESILARSRVIDQSVADGLTHPPSRIEYTAVGPRLYYSRDEFRRYFHVSPDREILGMVVPTTPAITIIGEVDDPYWQKIVKTHEAGHATLYMLGYNDQITNDEQEILFLVLVNELFAYASQHDPILSSRSFFSEKDANTQPIIWAKRMVTYVFERYLRDGGPNAISHGKIIATLLGNPGTFRHLREVSAGLKGLLNSQDRLDLDRLINESMRSVCDEFTSAILAFRRETYSALAFSYSRSPKRILGKVIEKIVFAKKPTETGYGDIRHERPSVWEMLGKVDAYCATHALPDLVKLIRLDTSEGLDLMHALALYLLYTPYADKSPARIALLQLDMMMEEEGRGLPKRLRNNIGKTRALFEQISDDRVVYEATSEDSGETIVAIAFHYFSKKDMDHAQNILRTYLTDEKVIDDPYTMDTLSRMCGKLKMRDLGRAFVSKYTGFETMPAVAREITRIKWNCLGGSIADAWGDIRSNLRNGFGKNP